MYKVIEIEDVVRIPPHLFDKSLHEAAVEVLKEMYEGHVVENIGMIISILEAKASEYGYIAFSDGALYHPTKFKALVFSPINQEVVEGEIVLVERVGVYIRLGPVDGFVHRSQVLASKEVTYNRDQGIIFDTRSGKVLRKGDKVRARVTGVSYGDKRSILRVRLTMRQQYLGKIDWIKEEINKGKR